MSESSLRERKKQKTRDQIIAAALDLFAERGFDNTTIADIAAAAEISPRTFFAYFPSKEDVVFADHEVALESFDRALRERPQGQDAIQTLRVWIGQIPEMIQQDVKRSRIEWQCIADSPHVNAKRLEISKRFEVRLARAVAEDLGEPPDGMRARMVAAAAIAALQTKEEETAKAIEDAAAAEQLATDPTAWLGDVLAFLEAGLAALRAIPPSA